jgi:hypothetical protein
MARSCTVCVHPEKVAIDKAIVAGKSRAEISTTYKVGDSAVKRHREANHVSKALIAVQARREERGAATVLDQINQLVDKVRVFIDRAEASGDDALTLKGIGELRSTLTLLARLTGELDERPTTTINVLASPEVAQLATALMIALAPYPQARIAAAAALDVEEVAS